MDLTNGHKVNVISDSVLFVEFSKLINLVCMYTLYRHLEFYETKYKSTVDTKKTKISSNRQLLVNSKYMQ